MEHIEMLALKSAGRLSCNCTQSGSAASKEGRRRDKDELPLPPHAVFTVCLRLPSMLSAPLGQSIVCAGMQFSVCCRRNSAPGLYFSLCISRETCVGVEHQRNTSAVGRDTKNINNNYKSTAESCNKFPSTCMYERKKKTQIDLIFHLHESSHYHVTLSHSHSPWEKQLGRFRLKSTWYDILQDWASEGCLCVQLHAAS